MSNTSQTPYKKLGTHLKSLREGNHESAAEVSSAVEIDETKLQNFEIGTERPSEDILLLLISHYGVHEDRAEELWRLAGYTRGDKHDDDMPGDMKQHAMMIMIDPRVMYSDIAEISANGQGIVLTFSQSNGPGSSPLAVSKIGMSREQAQAVMGLLHQALWNLDNPSNKRLSGGADQPNE